MTKTTWTYENILQTLVGIALPSGKDREVEWIDSSHLGLAVDRFGACELFLLADVTATLPLVIRHLKRDKWEGEDGGQFEASRLVFPPDDHYRAVTAFVAEELIRNGLFGASPAEAFAKTEPLIELALRRVAISEEDLLGILGELYLLETALAVAADNQQLRVKILDGWRGSGNSARDFLLMDTAIEVKATRKANSTHHVNGLLQVDPRRDQAGTPVEQLYLLSIGFVPAQTSNASAVTLPEQVEKILGLLEQPPNPGERSSQQELFLSKVEEYGSSGGGYHHDRMKNWSSYQQRYSYAFQRLYDMNDEAVLVLRQAQIPPHVCSTGLAFTVTLPNTISNDVNPEVDIHQAMSRILK